MFVVMNFSLKHCLPFEYACWSVLIQCCNLLLIMTTLMNMMSRISLGSS